jgi:hypothetical protein
MQHAAQPELVVQTTICSGLMSSYSSQSSVYGFAAAAPAATPPTMTSFISASPFPACSPEFRIFRACEAISWMPLFGDGPLSGQQYRETENG